MSVSHQKTPLASEREVRKNLRWQIHSDPFKIKCPFKAETEHTLETPSHCIPFSKLSSLASFRHVLNDALEKTFRIWRFSHSGSVKFFLPLSSGVFCETETLQDTHQQWLKFFRVFESVSYLVFILLWFLSVWLWLGPSFHSFSACAQFMFSLCPTHVEFEIGLEAIWLLKWPCALNESWASWCVRIAPPLSLSLQSILYSIWSSAPLRSSACHVHFGYLNMNFFHAFVLFNCFAQFILQIYSLGFQLITVMYLRCIFKIAYLTYESSMFTMLC
jgi:hypothetical protein